MGGQEQTEEKITYTGMNRLFRSRLLQRFVDSIGDGTYRDFVRDWQWIFSYSRKYWKIVLFYTFLGIFSTTLSLVSAVVSKYAIDIITSYQTSRVWLLVLIMAGSMAFSLVFSSLVERYSLKLSIYVNNDIQAEVFDKIIDADWSRLTEYPNGDLLNRFNSDVKTIAGNAVSWIPNVIICVYSFVAIFLVILHYDVTMAFITFLSAPVLLAFSRTLIKKSREYQKKVMEMNSRMMSFEMETFYNLDTIKSFGISGHYIKGLKKWQNTYKDFQLKYNLFCIARSVILSLLSAAVGFVAFGYCLYLLWTHAITYGTMTLFLSQRSNLSSSFNKIVGIIPGMINSTVSVQRIRELVELPKEQHDEEVLRKLMPAAKDGFTVALENVSFSYANSVPVLHDSRFVAAPGEIVALVGGSGEGKTTMLRLILGLIHPSKGEVLLIAKDGTRATVSADVRSLFSYVPQGNTIISGTVAENLRMVKEDATDEEIREALRVACAWDFVQKMSEGIDAYIGERGHGISEGQAQRIAIARAVLRNSPILLLDEATSALDAETERQVLDNIVKSDPHKTCIVITHRSGVLGMCQRIYRIVEGALTELSKEEAAEQMSLGN